jgi:hypothetical protein
MLLVESQWLMNEAVLPPRIGEVEWLMHRQPATRQP